MVFQHATPVVVDRLSEPWRIVPLTRLRGPTSTGADSGYREDFLQRLIDAVPSILPVEEIEPVFNGLRSVCTEMRLGSKDTAKYVDNLLVNPDGRLCLVECKLRRSYQSARAVIGQVLDYASELALLSYDGLVAAARRRLKLAEGDPIADGVLGAGADEEERADFRDAVSRSLRLGNFLLLVVADRIRPELPRIADLLQNHATLGFAFGLVEMAIYGGKDSEGPYYVQPRILARTEIVPRTVFVAAADAAPPRITKVEATEKPRTISEDEFYAGLAAADPSYPDRLRSFLDRCQELGCEPRLRRRFVLYVDDPTGGRLNLGTIAKDGTVEFWGPAGRDRELGEPIGRSYMGRVAAFLPGAVVKDGFTSPGEWYVRYKDKSGVPLGEMLRHEEQWLDAIATVAVRLREIEQARQVS